MLHKKITDNTSLKMTYIYLTTILNIYTTNNIENLNPFKKFTKIKTLFPTDKGLFKSLYLKLSLNTTPKNHNMLKKGKINLYKSILPVLINKSK